MTISTKYITKYEKARIIGTRALQISMNAPVVIDTCGETDCVKIACLEYEQKKIPIKIVRYLPNGIVEEFSVKDLIDIN